MNRIVQQRGAHPSVLGRVAAPRDLSGRKALLLVVLLIGVCSHVAAETVTFRGVSLPVDSLAPVQGEQTRVTLNQKAFLVPNDELAMRVASAYASEPNLLAKNVSWEGVVELITNCVESKDTLAVPFLQATLRGEDFLPAKTRELYRSLASSQSGAGFLELAVSSLDAPAANPGSWCDALTVLKESTRRLIQEKASRLVYRYQFQCTEHLQKRARAALGEGNLQEGLGILDTLAQMFADGSQQFIGLLASRNRLAKLSESVNSTDYSAVARIVRSLSDDPWIAPFAIDLGRGVIHLALEKALSDGKIGSALRLVTAIDFQRRTPKDHQFIIRALEGVSSSDIDSLMSDTVSVALSAFGRKDDGVQSAYLAALDRLTRENLSKGSLGIADRLAQRAFAVRPDPSPANDALRIEFVGKLLDAGAVFEAKTMAAELRTKTPMFLQLRLVLAGAYFDKGILFASAVAVVLAVVLVVWGRRRVAADTHGSMPKKPKRKQQDRSAEYDLGNEEEDAPPRRFVVYSHGVNLSQGPDEYTELLKMFALRPGASLQNIKVAYRNAVKTCHPDLNPNSGEAEAAKFIQLTRTYERLLDIHEQRTGEK